MGKAVPWDRKAVMRGVHGQIAIVLLGALEVAEARIAELERERDALKARLEVVDGWSEDTDGIACRNDTIALQDDRIKRLTDRATAAEARLAEVVEVIRAVHSEGMTNHNTRCKSWWSRVVRFIQETERG